MTLVLSPADVRQLLPMHVCVDLMEQAFVTLARGDAVNPLRRGMLLPENKGILGMMPGYLGAPEAIGLKVVTVFPGNHGSEYDAHQGVVVLFDPEHGVPSAIVDASEITAVRTAAATAVATRLLAREDAHELAIIGSGVQARAHLAAIRVVRHITRVRVYSPTAANKKRFAVVESERHDLPVDPVNSPEEAVAGADIVCTTTSAREPVLLGTWLRPGMHVNAVGSSVRTTRELDADAVALSRLFVDRRESTLNEAGDFLFAKAEGRVGDDHIVAEIGDLLLGTAAGRRDDREITLFKSLGLAVEDLAAAAYVFDRARVTGLGTTVRLGGLRE